MFTASDLFALIDAAPAVGVSIYMPTHVLGRETRQGPIRLKNLAGQALEVQPASGHDLLDSLTVRTLKAGGSVYVLPPDEMPEARPAAAILRY